MQNQMGEVNYSSERIKSTESDEFTEGMIELVQPTISQFCVQIDNTRQSQKMLSSKVEEIHKVISGLLKQLDVLGTVEESDFAKTAQSKLKKLEESRRRLNLIVPRLLNIESRVALLERNHSKKHHHKMDSLKKQSSTESNLK